MLDEIYELFFDLDAADHHIEFPVISAIARDGRAMRGVGIPSATDDLSALLDTVLETIPPPGGDAAAPLQALVTNLDASDYLGRLAIGRVIEGTLRKGQTVALCEEETEVGEDGIAVSPLKRRLAQMMAFEGIGRVEDADELCAGDLFVVAGFPEVEIGDTLADPEVPRPLPRLMVDEPVLRMTFGVNTAPTSGKAGKYVTSRHLRERLEREILGNVSIELTDTESPDVLEVAGRGELQLAVLIESMRREGYELEVSRPEVITREIDGKTSRAARARCRRRTRGARRYRHAGARAAHGSGHRPPSGRPRPQHRHVRGTGTRAHRLPLVADDRDAWHRVAPPAPRWMDPVGG